MPQPPPKPQPIQTQTLPPGFRIVDWLGTGQFGKVCKAHGPGGQECAFKVISLNRSSGDGLKEFRALHLIRRIKPHRHLIEYHGVWLLTSDGDLLDNADEVNDTDLTNLDVTDLLIQMPLAVKSLEARLRECQREFKKRGPQNPGDLPGIPIDELLPYTRGVAEALDHLHSPIHPLKDNELAWILHRDIKPANLLINAHGDVLVADYGVARAVGAGVKGSQTGAGTPIYIAPEQFTKKVENIAPASDQYSFAISYYEMRTASLPFFDDVRIELNDLKRAHILGRLDFSKLPPPEQEVLKRATNRTVNKRFDSCVAFADELWKANGWTPMPVRPRSAAIAYPAPRQAAPAPAPVSPGRITKSREGSRTDLEETAPPPPPTAGGTLIHGPGSETPAASSVPAALSSPSRRAPALPDPLPIAEPMEDSKTGSEAPSPWQAQTKTGPHPLSNSWSVPAAKAREKSRGPLYIAGGIIFAALIGLGVFFGTRPQGTGDKGGKGENTAEAKGGTSDLPIVKGTTPNVPTEGDFTAVLRKAQEAFARVSDGNLSQIDAGLDVLRTIPANAKGGLEAKMLAAQWDSARKLLQNKPLSLDDSERVAKWAPPGDMLERDVAPLRRLYAKLAEANPTAAARLQKAGDAYQHGAAIPAGRKAVSELLALNPKEPVLGTAKALLAAWDAAETLDNDSRTNLDKPVRLKTITDGLAALRSAAKTESLASHRKDLDEYYRTRLSKLIEKFAADPEELKTDPAAWASVSEKLPSAQELASPWLDLLRVESTFMSDSLGEGAKPSPIAELPAAAGNESAELAAYRKLVAAERLWQNSAAAAAKPRRAAADALLAAVAAEPIQKRFLAPARKRAFGQVFAKAAGEMKVKSAKPAPDDPYSHDPAALGLARRCLAQAALFLAGDTDRTALRKEARLGLLQAAAFPQADSAAAKNADFDPKTLEAALQGLPRMEAAGYRLAFARTRDFSTAAGAQDALAIYKPIALSILVDLKEPKPDLAYPIRFAGYLRDPAFVKAIPDDRKAATADEIYLPLARQFFERRTSLTGDSQKLPIDLMNNAAALTRKAELEALAGIYSLRITGDVSNADFAKKLIERDKNSPLTHAYYGLLFFYKAKQDDAADKPGSLAKCGTGLVDAIKKIKQVGDKESLLELLTVKLVESQLELGGIHEGKGQRTDAIAAYKRVIDNTNDLQAFVPSGRCQFNNTNDPSTLADAIKDLKSVPKSAADYPEARYWLALIDIWKATTLGNHSETNYEFEKRQLAGVVKRDEFEVAKGRQSFGTGITFAPSKLKTAAEAFADLPSGKSPFHLELLDWRACVSCALSLSDVESAEAAQTALADLKSFAAADPLRGTLRRMQYLTCRFHLARKLPDDLAAELWIPAAKRLDDLKKIAAPDRLKGDPNGLDAVLFDIAVLHVKGHAVALLEAQEVHDLEATQGYLEALAKMAEAKKAPEKVVAEFEAIGLVASDRSNAFPEATKKELRIQAAALAVRAFSASDQLDKTGSSIAAFNSLSLETAIVWRNFTSHSLEKYKLVKKEALDDPATIEDAIRVDVVYAQIMGLIARKKERGKADEEMLAKLRKEREEMIDKWATHILKAADAVEKTDPAKAKFWRGWKEERLKALTPAP